MLLFCRLYWASACLAWSSHGRRTFTCCELNGPRAYLVTYPRTDLPTTQLAPSPRSSDGVGLIGVGDDPRWRLECQDRCQV
ncbi:hypothetical protein HOY82DRAFT_545967, partial [Tuber indicum]